MTAGEIRSSSRHETDQLGRAIGRSLQGGEILALHGPLGAGKTVLVRGIAAGLGAAPTAVSSPTFVIIHEYRGRLPLVHVDLYRIGSTPELQATGLDDYLSDSSVMAVEWADKAREWLPDDRLEIELQHLAVRSRRIKLTARGLGSARLLRETERQLRQAARSGTRLRKT